MTKHSDPKLGSLVWYSYSCGGLLHLLVCHMPRQGGLIYCMIVDLLCLLTYFLLHVMDSHSLVEKSIKVWKFSYKCGNLRLHYKSFPSFCFLICLQDTSKIKHKYLHI